MLDLYREAVGEQAALRPMWPLADGLAEPAADAVGDIMGDPVPGWWSADRRGHRRLRLGAQRAAVAPGGGRPVCVVRLVYTTPEARGVGVGHAMLTLLMDDFTARGHRHFDARVSPGHRNAKNFFEAHGFSARLIVMYHDAGGLKHEAAAIPTRSWSSCCRS